MESSKLSYIQVHTAAKNLSTSATDMEAILNEVKGLFNKIGDEGTWSGTAAAQTKETFDQLSSKFSRFSESVMECHSHLVNVVIPGFKDVDSAITGQHGQYHTKM